MAPTVTPNGKLAPHLEIQRLCDTLTGIVQQVNDIVNTEASASTLSEDALGRIQPLLQQGSLLFLKLREFHRLANTGQQDLRKTIQDTKLEMDRRGQHLQNLLYEQAHIREEIKNCHHVNRYTSIELQPVEEFYQQAPESLRGSDEDKGEDLTEHQLTLNRLAFEKMERKRLEEERKAIVATKQALIQDNQKHQRSIVTLSDQIQEFLKASLDVKKVLESVDQESMVSMDL
ncbi:hypothetical protein IWQ62_000715 [Dispira parvispora]|uniref:Uncharacterized protein n=1 Tax=Dispira parvispora TaxID=1520584 RepID=A0A9W8AXS4_9FUNG|nr:hypothetical protein IWQ62_000715 [Dispira parvispora]